MPSQKVSAQKSYSKELDSLWSQDTNIFKLSTNGSWVVFLEKFPANKSILWLMSTNGNIRRQIPPKSKWDFSPDNKWFAYVDENNNMINLELETLKEFTYEKVTDFKFSYDGHFIALKKQDDMVLIINLDKRQENIIHNIIDFNWNPTKNNLLINLFFEDKSQLVSYCPLRKKVVKTMLSDAKNITDWKFSKNGNHVIFNVKNDNKTNRIHWYNLRNSDQKMLKDEDVMKLFPASKISDRKLFISDNGEKVLLNLQVGDVGQGKVEDVQVWSTASPWIEPRMREYEKLNKAYKLIAWYPEKGKIEAIESDNLPSAAIDVNHDSALLFNSLQYEPLYKFAPNTDLYIKNLQSGNTVLVVENQYIEAQFVTISPTGNHIAYFRDNNWWVYSVKENRNINLTENLNIAFGNKEHQFAGNIFPYGNLGWLPNDENIILYDKYDLWLMSPDGTIKKRITNGREDNIRYRIVRDYNSEIYKPLSISPGFSALEFDQKIGVVLETFNFNSYKTGIALWKDGNVILPIIVSDGKIDQIKLDQCGQNLVFRHQRINKPISIHHYDLKTMTKNKIFQSNEKLLQYDLGTTQILEYGLKDGTIKKGSLIYPSNYNPEKKYPMIVKIYQSESAKINAFSPPSDLMLDGFNPLRFITNDYFVFYPDFGFTIGAPGISAVESVIAATKKALETNKIDSTKIGLIGHSFGGYETAFIITQTNIFATAVAGTPVTDFVSYYHDIAWDWNINQMWRLENQQFRMGDSFYNIKEEYLKNSPLNFVENVTTPLLLWTGKKDTNINWSQSVYMFMALKRLNKEAKMILYNDEGHNIFSPANQSHLAQSIFNWMEYHLKTENKDFP